MKIYKCNSCASENACILIETYTAELPADPYECPYEVDDVCPVWKEVTEYPEQLKEIIQTINKGEKE